MNCLRVIVIFLKELVPRPGCLFHGLLALVCFMDKYCLDRMILLGLLYDHVDIDIKLVYDYNGGTRNDLFA